jgi:hypothetical protein
MLMDPGLTHTGAAAEREIMFPNEKKKCIHWKKIRQCQLLIKQIDTTSVDIAVLRTDLMFSIDTMKSTNPQCN